jgi:hypothetical protein
MNIPGSAIEVPAAWTAREMAGSSEWIIPISNRDIGELDAALECVKSRGFATPSFTRADFPLDRFAATLAEVLREVERGRGFVLIRGVPVERYSADDITMILWGIGTYLGEAAGQNRMGDVIGHVTDIGRNWAKDNHDRGYQTRSFLPFHCDKTDAVALLCLHPSKSGGSSCIASSVAIHNEILARRPDLLESLYRPFYVDLRGEEMEGEKPYNIQPVFTWYKQRLFTRYGRKYIKTGQRFDDAPRLSPDDIAVVDMVHDFAASDKFRLDMEFQCGDIQILNNHAILHSRTEYEDWPEPERKRHLLRLLLFTPGFADMPEHYRTIYETARDWRDNPRLAAAAAPIAAE